jgi:hypothetical protein
VHGGHLKDPNLSIIRETIFLFECKKKYSRFFFLVVAAGKYLQQKVLSGKKAPARSSGSGMIIRWFRKNGDGCPASCAGNQRIIHGKNDIMRPITVMIMHGMSCAMSSFTSFLFFCSRKNAFPGLKGSGTAAFPSTHSCSVIFEGEEPGKINGVFF